MTGWARLHGEFVIARRDLKPDRRQHYDDIIGAIMELVPSLGFPPGPMLIDKQAPLYMGYWHQQPALR